MKNLKISILIAAMTFCSGVHSDSFYERSVNNLGKVTVSQSNVPIGKMSLMLLPAEWQMSYMSDDMRNLVVSWVHDLNGRSQNWHDALRQIGVSEHLVFLVDGAEKHVYVTYPGYGRDPGVEIINSTSVVFKEDYVMQEIIKRSKANEMNWNRRQLQEEMGRYHTQKSELEVQLGRLADERQKVEEQLSRLKQTTAEVVAVDQANRREESVLQQAELIKEKQTKRNEITASAAFVFYVRQGLVLNDNARRFARDIGYDVMVIDKKVPVNCDWNQDVEYTITGPDPKKSFSEYVAPYGFKTNFAGGVVELIFSGSAENFAGCA